MKLKKEHLPKHVAFIMDGNRRWAKKNGLSLFKGHQLGEDRIEPLIDHAITLGIPYMTFWAFSTENWKRDKKEVEFLLNMFRNDLAKKVDRFHAKNVRLNIIGNLSMFPRDLQEKTREWMEKTKHNTTITGNVALSYGGRDELLRAINNAFSLQLASLRGRSRLTVDNITQETITNLLDTAGQPDPDLLIRTGGAQRLSGFMLWQMEYTELYFTDTYWPEFTPDEFDKALLWYRKQKRNFGK